MLLRHHDPRQKLMNSFSDLNECGVGGETHEEQHVHSIVQQIHAVIANLLYRAPGHKSGYEEPSDNQRSDARPTSFDRGCPPPRG